MEALYMIVGDFNHANLTAMLIKFPQWPNK